MLTFNNVNNNSIYINKLLMKFYYLTKRTLVAKKIESLKHN
jgi:hypothetical protein